MVVVGCSKGKFWMKKKKKNVMMLNWDFFFSVPSLV